MMIYTHGQFRKLNGASSGQHYNKDNAVSLIFLKSAAPTEISFFKNSSYDSAVRLSYACFSWHILIPTNSIQVGLGCTSFPAVLDFLGRMKTDVPPLTATTLCGICSLSRTDTIFPITFAICSNIAPFSLVVARLGALITKAFTGYSVVSSSDKSVSLYQLALFQRFKQGYLLEIR